MDGCGRKIGPFDCCTIVVGDCLDVMAEMPDGCVDLIVTSPPYNLGHGFWKMAGGGRTPRPRGIGYSDALTEMEYQDWQRTCLVSMMKSLAQGGSLIYNHKPRQRNGLVILPHRWLLDFPIHQEIIWDRNTTFNHNPTFFEPIDERLFWLCSSKPKIYGGMTNKSVMRFAFEINTPHPAPFPQSLPALFIDCLTRKGDLVADFFTGWGTTAIAARARGRHFFGCDINPDYVAMAEKRLNTVQLAMVL